MKPIVLAATAIAAFAVLQSGAQAQSASRGNQLIKAFAIEDLEIALDAIGATYEDAGDTGTINITFPSSLKANGAIMACDDDAAQKNCFGTSILAIFDPEAGSTPQEINAAINEYNLRQNFGRAYVDPSGDVSVRMYIIADGGITRDNYRSQIQLWARSLEFFGEYLYPGQADESGQT